MELYLCSTPRVFVAWKGKTLPFYLIYMALPYYTLPENSRHVPADFPIWTSHILCITSTKHSPELQYQLCGYTNIRVDVN